MQGGALGRVCAEEGAGGVVVDVRDDAEEVSEGYRDFRNEAVLRLWEVRFLGRVMARVFPEVNCKFV